jgi:hypothetical protein
MLQRIFQLRILGCCLAAACQPVNSDAVGEQPCDFGNVCPAPADGTIPVMTATPPILLDDGTFTNDPCVKVMQDSRKVRQVACAGCHNGQGALGAPLTFIMDDDECAQKEASAKFSGQHYLVPGDPEKSLIYKRAVLVGDMPPQSTDVANGTNPRPTISDYSVLRQWIQCLHR